MCVSADTSYKSVYITSYLYFTAHDYVSFEHIVDYNSLGKWHEIHSTTMLYVFP